VRSGRNDGLVESGELKVENGDKRSGVSPINSSTPQQFNKSTIQPNLTNA
jgi:hypothetical protein